MSRDITRARQKPRMFSDPALAAALTLKTSCIVWLGGFLGGMASGAAGFAYGVVATAIWLHAISPLHAAMLVVSGGLIMQSGLVFKMRRSLDWPRLAPFLIAGLIGIPIGVALVVKTDPSTIRLGVAVFLVVYGLYALLDAAAAAHVRRRQGGRRGGRLSRRRAGRARRIVRRAAGDLDAASRLAEGCGARHLPAVHPGRAYHDPAADRRGGARSRRRRAVLCWWLPAIAAGRLGRLDDLRQARRAAFPADVRRAIGGVGPAAVGLHPSGESCQSNSISPICSPALSSPSFPARR